MRRDIRSWDELELMISEIEPDDEIVIHLGGYQLQVNVEACDPVRVAASDY